MTRSAYHEAVGYFEQALRPLQHLPERRDTREQAIDLRLALHSALLPSNDSRRILAYLCEAEVLAVSIDDHRRLGHISGYLSVQFRNTGAYDQAIAAGQRALARAATGGDTVGHALANLYLGAAHWAQGDYREGIDCLRQTIASLPSEQRRERLGQATLPSVPSLAFLAMCHAEFGMFAEGRAFGEEGLQISATNAHPSSLMWASYGFGLLSLCQGDLHEAIPLLERAISICREADLRVFIPRMAAAIGAAYTLAGRVADAVPLLTQAMEQTMAPDMAGFQALCHLPLGAAHLLAGRLEDAHAIADGVLALAREHQERGNEAYASRLLGEIAAHRNPPESTLAAAHSQQALALAEELGMRPLMAHCHLGLGKLCLKVGQREQASVAITTAIDLYRTMEMRFWLPQAESALVQRGVC
jgi:tetratricopeptide (TPR) repeat protein